MNDRRHDPEPGIPPERLVELALDPSASAEGGEELRLAEDVELAGELAALRAFAERQRAAAREPSGHSAQVLAERVLDASTRARPGTMGDLVLVRDWIVDRCRQSGWARFAAASLLLHLAALPALAWYAWAKREPEPRLVFEVPELPQFEPAQDEDLRVEPPDVLPLLDGEPVAFFAPHLVENARRLARFVLHRTGAPRLEGAAGTTAIGALLAARSAGVNSGVWGALEAAAPVAHDPIAPALFAEAALDRAVLTGSTEGLRDGLAALDPLGSDLARAAALRALELGYTDEALRASWRLDEWYAGPSREPGRPMSAQWFTLLERELEGTSSDSALAAWLESPARPR